MSWIITGTQKTDPDVLAYLAEVERADGEALESGVRDAVISFVAGCKADGIWDAIKASCILAGARTLDGALVPLVGTAPTKNGTEGGWNYNRKTGLQGNGTDNYINTNRNNNADPQNSKSYSVFASTIGLSWALIASDLYNTPGWSKLGRIGSGALACAVNANALFSVSATDFAPGFSGASRNTSTESIYRLRTTNLGLISGSVSSTSATPHNSNMMLFSTKISETRYFGNNRISFYHIGESLDLAALDTRVTTLMSDLATAIP